MIRIVRFLTSTLLAGLAAPFAIFLLSLTAVGILLGLVKELLNYYSSVFAIAFAEFRYSKTIATQSLKGEAREIFEQPRGKRMIYARDRS
jgi:hypothetical protein